MPESNSATIDESVPSDLISFLKAIPVGCNRWRHSTDFFGQGPDPEILAVVSVGVHHVPIRRLCRKPAEQAFGLYQSSHG